MPKVDIFPIFVTIEPRARDYIYFCAANASRKNMIMFRKWKLLLYTTTLYETFIYK